MEEVEGCEATMVVGVVAVVVAVVEELASAPLTRARPTVSGDSSKM